MKRHEWELPETVKKNCADVGGEEQKRRQPTF